MNTIDKKAQGKRNRAAGQRFELLVRKDLEENGYITIKNPNNVINNKFTQGKSKYNPFNKRLMMNSGGFPDFLCYSNRLNEVIGTEQSVGVFGVECKTNGILDKTEKEKCRWLLDNRVFCIILIAKKEKIKNRIHIKYERFK